MPHDLRTIDLKGRTRKHSFAAALSDAIHELHMLFERERVFESLLEEDSTLRVLINIPEGGEKYARIDDLVGANKRILADTRRLPWVFDTLTYEMTDDYKETILVLTLAPKDILTRLVYSSGPA